VSARNAGGARIVRVSLPFYQWSITAARSIPRYPAEIGHIGHRLLKRRLELRLQQKEAAKSLGVHPGCLENWNTGGSDLPVDSIRRSSDSLDSIRCPRA
jgi:hypothetical protein